MPELPSRNPSETNRILRIQRIQACVRQANAEARTKQGRVMSLEWIKHTAHDLFARIGGASPITEEEFWREQDEVMGRTVNYKELGS